MLTHAAAVLGTPLNAHMELQVMHGTRALSCVQHYIQWRKHEQRHVLSSLGDAFHHTHGQVFLHEHSPHPAQLCAVMYRCACHTHAIVLSKAVCPAVQGYLHQLKRTSGVARVPEGVHRLLASKACHSAIRQALHTDHQASYADREQEISSIAIIHAL